MLIRVMTKLGVKLVHHQITNLVTQTLEFDRNFNPSMTIVIQ